MPRLCRICRFRYKCIVAISHFWKKKEKRRLGFPSWISLVDLTFCEVHAYDGNCHNLVECWHGWTNFLFTLPSWLETNGRKKFKGISLKGPRYKTYIVTIPHACTHTKGCWTYIVGNVNSWFYYRYIYSSSCIFVCAQLLIQLHCGYLLGCWWRTLQVLSQVP